MAQFLFFLSEHVDELLVLMFVQFLEVVFKEWIRGILKRGDTKKKAQAKDAKKKVQAKDAKEKAEIPENVESESDYHQPTYLLLNP